MGSVAVGNIGQCGGKTAGKGQSCFNQDKAKDQVSFGDLRLDQTAESHPEKHQSDYHGPLLKRVTKDHGRKACLDIFKNNPAGPAGKHAQA